MVASRTQRLPSRRSPRRRSSWPLDRIHHLWDEIADYDASQVDQALEYTLGVLSSLIGAQNAFWVGVVRMASDRPSDPLRGWRPRAIKYLHPSPADVLFYQQSTRDLEAGVVDASTLSHTRDAGRFRASLLRELVPRQWRHTRGFDLAYRARHVVDAAFVIAPVNAQAESYYGFHRRDGHPRFTTRERDIAAYALRSLGWFHRHLLLSRGLLIAASPLTPAEQRVLRLLLTGLSENEIARRLGLGVRTTHGHVTAIFRKFNVSGRAGLTALWLGHQPPGPPAPQLSDGGSVE
jgi:DNA-binding CsgD family transcriptional regulator